MKHEVRMMTGPGDNLLSCDLSVWGIGPYTTVTLSWEDGAESISYSDAVGGPWFKVGLLVPDSTYSIWIKGSQGVQMGYYNGKKFCGIYLHDTITDPTHWKAVVKPEFEPC